MSKFYAFTGRRERGNSFDYWSAVYKITFSCARLFDTVANIYVNKRLAHFKVFSHLQCGGW